MSLIPISLTCLLPYVAIECLLLGQCNLYPLHLQLPLLTCHVHPAEQQQQQQKRASQMLISQSQYASAVFFTWQLWLMAPLTSLPGGFACNDPLVATRPWWISRKLVRRHRWVVGVCGRRVHMHKYKHAHTHMGWLEVDSRRRVAWMRWRQHISVIYGVQEDHYGHFNLSLMDVSKCLLSWSLMAPCNQWNTWPPLPPQLNPPAILFFLKRGPRGLSFKRR